MSLDIEMHTYLLLQNRKDKHIAKWLWLSGIKEMTRGKCFDIVKLEAFTRSLQKDGHYYMLADVDFERRHRRLLANGLLSKHYLPINKEYHLAIWLMGVSNDKNACYKIYSEYFNDPKERLPAVELRYSDFYDNDAVANSPKSQLNDLLDVFDANIEHDIMIDSYNALESLISKCAKD